MVAAVANGHRTPAEIAAACGVTLKHVGVDLVYLVKAGHLLRVARGVYAVPAGGR